MRKRPLVIALSIVGVIAGTHAGIAAINNDSTVSALPAAASETQAATETPMPGDAVAVVQTPAPVEAQPPAEGAAQPASALAMSNDTLRTAAPARDDEYQVRLPFTNRQIKVTVPTFPKNSQEFADPAPSVVAYFDKRNANTQLAGAASPVFPGGSDEFAKPQPSVVAYFDQMAARNLAAATPAAPAAPAPTVATAEVSTVAMTVPSAVKTPGN